MYWVSFIYLAIDSIYRDLKYRKISNFLLLINLLFLTNFWNKFLLLIFIAPFLIRWIGAGDLKLIAVLYLYSRALNLNLNYWLITAALLGLLTALLIRSKSIPFAPSLIIALLISDYLAQEGRQI